jgi:chemotaxis protein methyltransferase CheR
MTQEAADDKEIDLLQAELLQTYGYDFRQYSRASLKRRAQTAMLRAGCKSISDLLQRVRAEPGFHKEVVSDLMVNVTEMFRDPEVYSAIRQYVIPILRTYPSIRIWHAGCATGEEVYSMAILLKEEGLLERSFLYGTDISPRAIGIAKSGAYSPAQIQAYTLNYQKAGGSESFANYYLADRDGSRIDPLFKNYVLFSQHNLATDDVFTEAHLVLCRNVLIYFSQELQERTLHLINRALVHRGVLVLGTKESMEFTSTKDSFEFLRKNERIYRKI